MGFRNETTDCEVECGTRRAKSRRGSSLTLGKMKPRHVIPFTAIILASCSHHSPKPTSNAVVPTRDPNKWDWEFHGGARAVGWYKPSVVVALPKEISEAKLEPATFAEISTTDAAMQKTYGSHWMPFGYLYREGDTLWWWTGHGGRRGFLIKSGDQIKAWRFVHYGPY